METKKIGSFELGEKQIKQFLSRMAPEQQAQAEQNEEYKKQIWDRLEEITLFAALGEENKLEESEAFKEAMAASRRDYIAQLAMTELLKDITAEDDEMAAYYEEHQDEFMAPASAKAKHILVDDEDKAKELKASIEAGELEFEAAAKEHSSCPSAQQGGDLGQFGKGQMVPEFDEAVFAASEGDLLGPVKTQFGYHLIKVDELKEEAKRAFEEVAEQIKQMVVYNKQSEVYEKKLAELKDKYLK